MNTSLPFPGWLLILFLILLVISLNISLFTSLKKKNQKKPWISNLQRAGKMIQDPFWSENQKMDELAQNIKNLNLPSEKGMHEETPLSSEETKSENQSYN